MRQTASRHVAATRMLTLTIALGAVLLAGLAGKPGSVPYTALLSLGIALFTATIVTSFGWIFGTEALALMEERLGVQRALYESGLREVHMRSGNDDFFHDLSHATSVDIMHASGLTFMAHHVKDLETALATRRCRVRVLLTHPDNIYLKTTELKEALCPQTDLIKDIPIVLQRLVYLINNTALLAGASIEVRGYQCMPTGSIVIINDEAVRYTPYLPYAHSADVPVFDLDKSPGPGLVDHYRATFERVWLESDLLHGSGEGIGQGTRRNVRQSTSG